MAKYEDIPPPQPGLPLKWADAAMYRSDPMPDDNRAPGGGARPTVRLLNATADPLGSLAAVCGIYEGRVVRSLAEVSDEQRRAALKAMQETVLNGPLESVQFHFLIEGVTRAFTHQAVRSRFSFFAQESLRFAVPDGEHWTDRQAYPPSLARNPEEGRRNPPPLVPRTTSQYVTPEDEAYAQQRRIWDDAIIASQQAYQYLIDTGVPAEDARGLMPHSITTRYHWIVSLRTLLEEAGKRLCTQAQFEWRLVMAEVAQAIRAHGDYLAREVGQKYPRKEISVSLYRWTTGHPDWWQWHLIADQLRPVCYQEGRCGFMAKFDRGCKIRDRVNANAAIGRPSSEWKTRWAAPRGEDSHLVGADIPAIQPEEWLADPGAAR